MSAGAGVGLFITEDSECCFIEDTPPILVGGLNALSSEEVTCFLLMDDNETVRGTMFPCGAPTDPAMSLVSLDCVGSTYALREEASV